MSGKDPFGCDPFASLQPSSAGGPPPRPESPSPALPPKKSKQPPPRPAPPRPMQQPAVARAAPVPPTPSPDPHAPGHDPFADPFGDSATVGDPFSGANSSGTNSFANFANFDSKVRACHCSPGNFTVVSLPSIAWSTSFKYCPEPLLLCFFESLSALTLHCYIMLHGRSSEEIFQMEKQDKGEQFTVGKIVW